MKKIIFTLLLLIPMVSIVAQDNLKKSRKEIRAEAKIQKKQEITNLINSKSFVFNATQAIPMGAGTVVLNYYFDVKINGDTIYSYLPYYGVAYQAEYGSRNSPLDFIQPIENYTIEENKKGYHIDFDVINKNDHLNFSFQISELGYASLNITSSNRQSISYSGTIDPLQLTGETSLD